MVGNVDEWTEDCYHNYYNDAPTDGSAWLDANGGNCDEHVVRGGNWNNGPQDVRSAFRGWEGTLYRYDNLGFRVARALLTG